LEDALAAFDVVKARSWAEKKLIVCARRGEWCKLGESRPTGSTHRNTIRAQLLRSLLLAEGFHESGVKVEGAFISGTINLDGVSNIRKLHISKSEVDGDVSFCDAVTTTIQLQDSKLGRILGYGAKIDGDLLLWESEIEGGVHLFGLEVAGTLSCEGSHFGIYHDKKCRNAFSINLDTASVGGNLHLNSLKAEAEISLKDASIAGMFDCSEGKFSDRSNFAIKAHRLNLGGSLYLRDCESDGEVSFSGAQIGGDLDCRNGHFRAAEKDDTTALRFTRIELKGNVDLSKGFRADGKVQLNGARIRGNIDCRGGVFSVPARASKDFAAPDEALSEDAMSLVNAEVMGALILAPIEGKDGDAAELHGSLDLKGAYVRVLVDDERSWPRADGPIRNVIHLDGFAYERFSGAAPVEADIRMKWLLRQPRKHMGENFRPQPFEQVIKVLKEMGHPEEARRLAIERQGFLIRRRMAQWRKGPRGAVRALAALVSALTVGLLIGHGYRPLRVLAIMAAVGVAFGFYFKAAADRGVFAPRDAQVFLQPDFEKCRPHAGGNWTACAETVGDKFAEYPRFNPWVYSFNVLFPIVDLYQEKSWVPMQKEVRFELGDGLSIEVPSWGTKALVWTELVFGGVASLLAVAAFSGLVKTD
jgi:hypothetical protein